VASDPVEHRATVRALRLTAERALGAHQEASALTKELRALVQAMAPALLAQPGVGPVTAAQLLISWSHRGRLRSEAAFAMLAGVAPIPASSGLVVLSAQSGWRPAAEPGAAHHRHDPRGTA
jgi:transposase